MGLTILIVDDNRIMREMIARAVRLAGVEIDAIHEAGDGRAALAAVAARAFDLVLLDINMPVMDGEQFLVELRGDPAHRALPVVVCSSESSLPRIARFRLLGAGFVHKPFRPEELNAQLAKVRPDPAGAKP